MIYDKVFPLADALQLEIKIYRQGNLFELRGEREFSFPLSKESDLKMKVSIEGSTISDTASAILVKILGNFWVYLTFDMADSKDGTLTIYFLDVANTNTKNLKYSVDGATFDTAMMAILPLVKRTFFKEAKAIEWTTVSELDVLKVAT